MRLINFCIFLSSFCLTGRITAQSAASLSARPCRIVVIGSSTAAGTGASTPDSAWVNRYRVWLKSLNPANEVINLARGGYGTYQLMPSSYKAPPARPLPDTLRNITKALAQHPDAIIINLPSNDAAAGWRQEEQQANFDVIIRRANKAHVPVWISTTQPRHFSADKVLIQLFMRDYILRKYGRQAIDFWTHVAMPNGLIDRDLNSGDGIHLNNKGHRLLFERVRDKNIPAQLAAYSIFTKCCNRL